MIVVDGSALFAILLDEPYATECADVIAETDTLLMPAASLTELLIVAARKGILDLVRDFVDALDLTIVPVTEHRARAAANWYRSWGIGFHEAKLSFADSFAYALAKENACPLLFIGNDFAQTDIEPAFRPVDPPEPTNP